MVLTRPSLVDSSPDDRRPDPPVGPAPSWKRPDRFAIAARAFLLAATASLYLIGLGSGGWGNGYYAAAAQAGAESWRAMFFGALDSPGFTTLDKPPAATWVMSLSVRVFGLHPWSVLVPQALMGVAAVALLEATVRRQANAVTGLLAAAVFAVTPVAVRIFRFDDPDALLVLLLVAAAYAWVRAIESNRRRWVVLAGLAIGTAFLAKMAQALLVAPAFVVAFSVCAHGGLRQRLSRVALFGAVSMAAAGWWLVAVTVVPATQRPWVGGTTTNSVLDLALGYNGLGRLSGTRPAGDPTPPVVSGGAGPGRLFQSAMGGQGSWLLHAAMVGAVVLLWRARDRDRRDPRWSSVTLWGPWLFCAGTVISLSRGLIQPYYTLTLSPAIAALASAGAVELWRLRTTPAGRVALAALLAATAAWTDVLLCRVPSWQPWLRNSVPVAAVAIAGILLWPRAMQVSRVARSAAAGSVAVALAGPLAFSVVTAAAMPPDSLAFAGPVEREQLPGPPRQPCGARINESCAVVSRPGSLLWTSSPAPALTSLIARGADRYRWAAATVGANNAVGLQLASRHPVAAVGGYYGTDVGPTLAQFQQMAQSRRVHWFVDFGRFDTWPRTSPSTADRVTEWVRRNFPAQHVGRVAVYDLSRPATASNASR